MGKNISFYGINRLMPTRTKGEEIEYLISKIQNPHSIKPSKLIFNYAVDTFASVSFYLPVNMVNEVFLAGMPFEQSVKVRMAGAVISLFSARVYGRFRDGFYRLTNTSQNSGNFRKFFIDTTSNLTYGLPIYVAQMAMNGVSGKHILAGVCASVTSGLLTARPYGLYLDMLRKVTNQKT